MTTSHAWIRHTDDGAVEFWFPFDADLVNQLKAFIPWQHRRWVDNGEKRWVVAGAYAKSAETWFALNCGRGKEVARGQMEMFG